MIIFSRQEKFECGLGGLLVSALDLQAGYRGFESRSGRDNFQTISTPSSYSTCPGLSIKWTGQRLVTDSGTKCAWVIHESKAVQLHVHKNRRCLYVPRVPGSVKNPHNNNKFEPMRINQAARLLKHFSCSAHLNMKFVMLINIKLQTIVNSFLLSIAKHENSSANIYENANYCWHFHIY